MDKLAVRLIAGMFKMAVLGVQMSKKVTLDVDKYYPLNQPEVAAPSIQPQDMPSTKETVVNKKLGTHCVPCAINHLSTCSGSLSEALRFARSDGMGSPEVIQRLGLCQDELNIMERVDMRAEVVEVLPHGEKEIAHNALSGTRGIRHKLEHLNTVDQLENVTAEAQRLRTQVGQQWFKEKFKALTPQEQARVKEEITRKLATIPT